MAPTMLYDIEVMGEIAHGGTGHCHDASPAAVARVLKPFISDRSDVGGF